MRPLYHLVQGDELERFTRDGAYAPPSLSSEGFIHLSYLHQVEGTVARFFAGRADLSLVEIAPKGLPVREDPADGDRFPHLYGPLPRASIARVHALPSGRLTAELAELSRLLAAYAWYDHPEGPLFVETHRDARRTSGHWLFTAGATSAFHQVLDSHELWLIHRGRLVVHTIDPAGVHGEHALGGGGPAVLEVPSGHWQAAELPPGESFAFGSNVCAPPFEFATSFRLGTRGDLQALFPAHARLIDRLTHGAAEDVKAPPPDWKAR